MQTIKLHTHVGDDGLLRIEVPLDVANADLEVVLVVHQVDREDALMQESDLGWPPGFFEQTYGSLRDEPLVRELQGEYELREEIA